MTVGFFVFLPAYAAFSEGISLNKYAGPGLPILSFCLYPPPEASFVAAGPSPIFYNAPEWLWDGDPQSTIGVALLASLSSAVDVCHGLASARGLLHYYESKAKEENIPEAPSGGLRPVTFANADFARALVAAQVGDVEQARGFLTPLNTDRSDITDLKSKVATWLDLNTD